MSLKINRNNFLSRKHASFIVILPLHQQHNISMLTNHQTSTSSNPTLRKTRSRETLDLCPAPHNTLSQLERQKRAYARAGEFGGYTCAHTSGKKGALALFRHTQLSLWPLEPPPGRARRLQGTRGARERN